jgi:hypothetical protein
LLLFSNSALQPVSISAFGLLMPCSMKLLPMLMVAFSTAGFRGV